MATEIGIITALVGTATAISADGTVRNLQVGDTVYQNDLITTGAAGAVEIEFLDGSTMDMGRSSQAMLDLDVFDPSVTPTETAETTEVTDDIAAIQQALLEGEDPTVAGEATAAGPGAGADGSEGGHDFVVRDYLNPEVTPDSGFETTGPDFAFLQDEEELNLIDANGLPTAGLTEVLIDEDDLVTDGQLDLGATSAEFLAYLNSELGINAFGFDSPQGVGDERTDLGDDTGSPDGHFLGGTLVADYGSNGPNAETPIIFNVVSGSDVTDSEGNPVTSQGQQVKYWVSADGLTVIGYIADGGNGQEPPPQLQDQQEGYDGCEGPGEGYPEMAQIIFTAQLTPTAEGGSFLVGIFGQFDHEAPDYENGEFVFENNMFLNLGFTISDADGDTATGTLQINVDDDSPVRAGDEEQLSTQTGLVYEDGLSFDNEDLSEGNPNATLGITITSDDSDAEQSDIESFLGLPAGALEPAVDSNGGDGDAGNGSAAKTTLDVVAGDIISFNWSFDDNDGGTYNDFAFVVINGEVIELADSNGGNLVSNPFTYEVTTGGEITIGFGQMNVGDNVADSSLSVSNLTLNGNPVGDGSVTGWDTLGNVSNATELFTSSEASGNLNSLVNMGADVPGSFALLQPSENPFEQAQYEAALASLPTLSSKGEAVTYSVFNDGDESVLVATAGEGEDAREVFTLTIDSDGEWTFDLNDQLDHVAGETAEENFSLVTLDENGEPNGSVDHIDFTQLLQIRDFDGDQLIITEDDAGMFTISIRDDVPVVGESTALVDDDALEGGNEGGIADDNGNASFTGSLNATVGSDEPAAFSFAPMDGQTAMIGTEEVTFSYDSDTNTLTATGPRGDLFTVELTDTASGDYTVTLLDNVLHESLDGEDGDNTENNALADLTYSITDEDGDTVEGTLNVSFDDDMPVAADATVSVTVNEDDIRTNLSSGNDPYDNAGDGSYTGEPITIFGYTTDFFNQLNGGGPATTTGSVASLVSFGADAENATFSLGDNFATLIDQGLTSKGEDLSYEVQGDTLIASAGDRAVFTLQLDDNGDFNFKLYDQLDHAPGEGENNLSLDLSSVIQATDGDNDTITLDSGFTVDVTDDVPEEDGILPDVRFVEEEALSGGNQELSDIYPDTAVATGSLQDQVSVGADDSVTFSFAEDLSGLPELTSNDMPVTYEVDGDTLTASTAAGDVFTLKLESNGNYTFTLLGAIDHSAGQGENIEAIDFSSIVEATDFDGDSITLDGDFYIKVVDDSPEVGNNATVLLDDDALEGGNAGGIGDDADSANVTGTLAHSFGADGAGSISWLTTGAPTGFTYVQDGASLLIQQGGTTVLTLTLDSETGDYTVTQNAPVQHAEGQNENNQLFDVQYQVTDGDNDSVNGTITINVDDDTPEIVAQDIQIMSESFENFAPDLIGNNFTVVGEGGQIVGNNGIVWNLNAAGIEIQSGNVGGSEASDGNVHAELDTDNNDTLLTVLSTDVELPSSEVTLSFDYKPRPGSEADSDMNVTLGGKTVTIDSDSAGNITFSSLPEGVTVNQETNPATGWTTITFTYSGLSTAAAQTLAFQGLGNADEFGAYLDNINMSADTLGLTVDESDLTTDATADFSQFFADSFSYGADGPGDIDYSLSLNAGDTGIVDTATDEAVILVINGGVVEGRTEFSNDLVFTLSVNGDGVATLDQLRAVKHADETNPDDAVSLNSGLINLNATISDADGDEATASVDASGAITFKDDGPSIAANQPEGITTITVENKGETEASHLNSYGYYIKGEDGEPVSGAIIWANVKENETEQVNIDAEPEDIGFFIIPDGATQNPGLENGAEVTFEQDDQGNWVVLLDGVQLKGDGNSDALFNDPALNPANFNAVEDNTAPGNQNWEDILGNSSDLDFDDVNIDVTVVRNGFLVVDETDIGNGDPSSATATLSLAASFAIDFGADGEGEFAYNLDINTDVDTGLVDTLSGKDVALRITDDGDVEGFITSDDAQDYVVFTVTIDENGLVTLTQLRAVEHDDVTDPDEADSPATINAGALLVTGTVTDGDGDSVSDEIDLGVLVAFEDDGPSIGEQAANSVDEGNTTTGTLVFDAGQDGGGITHIDDTELEFGQDGFSQEIDLDHGTIKVKANGEYSYTVDSGSVEQDEVENFNFTVTDGDGDTAQGAVAITIVDAQVADVITLNDVTVDEGDGTATITGSVENPVTGTPLVITLDNGATITIPVGDTSAESTPFAVQGDDVYLDGESYTVEVTGTTGGNYSSLDTSDDATVSINDTIDTVTATLTTSTSEVSEDGGDITYTITLSGGPGDIDPDTDLVFNLANGEQVTIQAGDTSGSYTRTYTDGEITNQTSISNSISSIASGGSEYEDLQTAGSTTVDVDYAPEISDLTPAASGGDVTVDEDDLTDGSDSSKESTTQQGTFTISSGDAIDDLSIGGNAVITNGTFSATSFTTALGNTLSITGYNAVTGEITYTYELLDNTLTHGQADNGENSVYENFAVSLTDIDGDEATDTLSVQIVDDVPEIVPQSFGTIEDGETLSDISLESLFGADGAGDITFDASLNGSAVLQNGEQVFFDGEALTWSLDGDVLTASTGSDVDAITITLNDADGNYDISVAEGTFYLEGDEQSFAIGDLSGSNAEAWAAQTDGIDTLIVSEGTSTNTSNAGNVGYVGAGSQWIDADTSDSTTFYFYDDINASGALANQTEVDNALANSVVAGVSSFSIGVNTKGGAETTIELTFTAVDGTQGTATVAIGSNGPSNPFEINIDSSDISWDGGASNLSIASVEFESGDVDYRVGGDLVFNEITPTDIELDLPVTITDADGDVDSGNITGTISSEGVPSSLALTDIPDELYVGTNEPNTKVTDGGNDVLIGDLGGREQQYNPGSNYSIALIADESGSMEGDRLTLLKDALESFVNDLADHDGVINIALIGFGENASLEISVNDLANNPDGLTDLIAQIEALSANGGTNYEAAFDAAVDWFGGQPAGHEFISYFMTDGDPTYSNSGNHGSGNTTQYEDLYDAVQAFQALSNISEVNAIGIGSGVNENYLRFFDNTNNNGVGTEAFGTSTSLLADFTDQLYGSDFEVDVLDRGWTATGDANGNVTSQNNGIFPPFSSPDGYLRVRDNSGNGATVATSALFMIPAGITEASLQFDYRTANTHPNDSFGWQVQKDVAGNWVTVESGSLNRTENYTEVNVNGLDSGAYRIVYTVNDSGNGNQGNAELRIDDVLLTVPDDVVTGPVGQPQIINTAGELIAELQEGNTTDTPVDLGDDVLEGGDGDDVIFGDTIFTDDLTWTNGDTNEEFTAGHGLGYEGLVEYLTWAENGGTAPDDAQIMQYIRDNYESLINPNPTQAEMDAAGNDTLIGGAGNDILIGGDGADIFQWNEGDDGSTDAPAVDYVVDFDAGEGDVLDVSDLLNTAEASDNLDNYLVATYDAGNDQTKIDVYTAGDAQSGGQSTQSIVVNGDQQDLAALLTSGNLNVDQS